MKKTYCGQATNGEYTVQYKVAETGGPVDILSAQYKGEPLDICSDDLEERIHLRLRLTRIAEADADKAERFLSAA